jgi:hypothetical protein
VGTKTEPAADRQPKVQTYVKAIFYKITTVTQNRDGSVSKPMTWKSAELNCTEEL